MKERINYTITILHLIIYLILFNLHSNLNITQDKPQLPSFLPLLLSKSNKLF